MVFFSKSLSALFAVAAVSLLVFPAAATSSSQLCPAGTYSLSGKGPSCLNCPRGTYSDSPGSTKCQSADAGSVCENEGSTSQSRCAAGYYSASGSKTCTVCPAGSYCPDSGTTSPSLCPPGYYTPSTGARSCNACAKGSFTNIYGAKSCCQCAPGWYSDSSASKSCTKCAKKGAYSQGYCSAGSTGDGDCSARSGALSSSSQSSDGTCPSVVPPSTPSQSRRHHARSRICSVGHKSCPVIGARGLMVFECVSVHDDLESCGGCVGNDSPNGKVNANGGRDCSAIPNVDAVSCSAGSCLIQKCRAGFSLSDDGSSCVA